MYIIIFILIYTCIIGVVYAVVYFLWDNNQIMHNYNEDAVVVMSLLWPIFLPVLCSFELTSWVINKFIKKIKQDA